MTATPLPQNTTNRLLAVAEIVETEGRWNQRSWGYDYAYAPTALYESPWKKMAGKADCGSSACMAGWGVRLSPASLFDSNVQVDCWACAGLVAFGLEANLTCIFSQDYRPTEPGTVLRILATLIEGERTLDRLIAEVEAKGLYREVDLPYLRCVAGAV